MQLIEVPDMDTDKFSFPIGIQAIYIFSESGIPIFTRSGTVKHVDEMMMSGFLSAIFSFAEEVVEGIIRTMEVGNSIFVFERAGGCIFTVNGTHESNTLYLEYILRQLVTAWEQQYGSTTEPLSDSRPIFDGFESTIQQVLQKSPPEDILREIEQKTHEQKPISIPFLLRSTRKGLDKVLGAIISGTRPVIVIGDRARVELAIDTLKQFIPYQNTMQVISWTDHIVENADIIGMDPTQLGEPAKNIVVLDLVLSRVVGGQTSKFARQLLKELEKLQENEVLALVNAKIGALKLSATKCVQLSKTGQMNAETFAQFIQNLDPQAVELFLDVCNRMFPIEYLTIAKLYADYKRGVESRIESYLEDF